MEHDLEWLRQCLANELVSVAHKLITIQLSAAEASQQLRALADCAERMALGPKR